MSIEANPAVRGKPPHPPRKKSKQYRAPHPGAARVAPSVDDSIAARAVYSGRDLLGSYRNVAGRWLAVDRLGRPIGQFDTELAAANAIAVARSGHHG